MRNLGQPKEQQAKKSAPRTGTWVDQVWCRRGDTVGNGYIPTILMGFA